MSSTCSTTGTHRPHIGRLANAAGVCWRWRTPPPPRCARNCRSTRWRFAGTRQIRRTPGGANPNLECCSTPLVTSESISAAAS